jgi:hypothetical protein
MEKKMVLTEGGRQYVEAYEKHYTNKDVYAALQMYKKVTSLCPDSKEAEHSRSQILNIVREVVPKDVLFEAQLNLALDYAKRKSGSNTRLVEHTVPASTERSGLPETEQANMREYE